MLADGTAAHVPARRRAFPVFSDDHAAQLVTLCSFIVHQAIDAGQPALAEAGRKAREPEYRHGFLRWCWINRLDVLTPGACSVPAALLRWQSRGCPDGIDCCLSCGSPTWEVSVVPDAVPVARGGVVATGKLVAYGRCSTCDTGSLIDVMA